MLLLQVTTLCKIVWGREDHVISRDASLDSFELDLASQTGRPFWAQQPQFKLKKPWSQKATPAYFCKCVIVRINWHAQRRPRSLLATASKMWRFHITTAELSPDKLEEALMRRLIPTVTNIIDWIIELFFYYVFNSVTKKGLFALFTKKDLAIKWKHLPVKQMTLRNKSRISALIWHMILMRSRGYELRKRLQLYSVK